MNKLIVLDFETGKVYVYIMCVEYDPKKNEEFEEYITTKGHSLNNVEWMITDQEIIIK